MSGRSVQTTMRKWAERLSSRSVPFRPDAWARVTTAVDVIGRAPDSDRRILNSAKNSGGDGSIDAASTLGKFGADRLR